ncbi:SPOR domain-containing protein [Donghicola sp. XS_ASV15]|uniref:SPOR domain-containing protein n=1 Tax=Donghicola sp. XS_ASV15 TaxID=3241295 RepID=UPI003516FA54
MNRLFAAATACLVSTGAACAQTPVNFPPSDFEGRQFVDNKGCAYIRVGVGPTVDWIPRMTRSRDQVCGLQPTFRTPTQTVEAPAAPTPTPAPAAKPAPAPAKVAVAPTPQPKVVVAAPATTTKRTAKSAPTPTVASKVATRPTVASRTVLAPTSVTSSQAVRTASAPSAVGSSVCPERTGVSAQYTNSQGVRCGPQSVSPVKVLSVGGANQPLPEPPKGYTRIWQDDRLNPYRGPRTAAGNAQSDAVWDKQTPRNLRTDPGAQAVRTSSLAPISVQGAGSYVQVATFSVGKNAQRTAQRFQSAGFPVRILSTRSGQQIVMVGAVPGGSLQQTLASARQAGFSDAFIR